MPCAAAPSTSWVRSPTITTRSGSGASWASACAITSALVARTPSTLAPAITSKCSSSAEVLEDPPRGRLGLRGGHRQPHPGRPQVGQQLRGCRRTGCSSPSRGWSSRRGRRRSRRRASPSPMAGSVWCIGGPTMRPARSPSGISAPICAEGVTEAGHDALRRVGQGAVEVEDHQLRPGRRGGVVQGRHASIVSDGALVS